jgi:hypothetical protein
VLRGWQAQARQSFSVRVLGIKVRRRREADSRMCVVVLWSHLARRRKLARDNDELSAAFSRMRVTHKLLREWRDVTGYRRALLAAESAVRDGRWRRSATEALRLLAKGVGFRKLKEAALREADSIFLIPWVLHLRGRTLHARRLRQASAAVTHKTRRAGLADGCQRWLQAVAVGRERDAAASRVVARWVGRALVARAFRGLRAVRNVGQWSRWRRLKRVLGQWVEAHGSIVWGRFIVSRARDARLRALVTNWRSVHRLRVQAQLRLYMAFSHMCRALGLRAVTAWKASLCYARALASFARAAAAVCAAAAFSHRFRAWMLLARRAVLVRDRSARTQERATSSLKLSVVAYWRGVLGVRQRCHGLASRRALRLAGRALGQFVGFCLKVRTQREALVLVAVSRTRDLLSRQIRLWQVRRSSRARAGGGGSRRRRCRPCAFHLVLSHLISFYLI